MTIALVCPNKATQPWIAALKAIDASIDVQVWPNEQCRDNVEFALCWQHPTGVLKQYSNLRCIASMGAGVDHLFNDADLPQHLPVVRLVDPLLAQSMFEYVCAAVMAKLQNFSRYQQQQDQGIWQQYTPQTIAQTTIGIMGLGQIGSHTASQLAKLSFNVVGWSRSPKSIPNVRAYAGPEQLSAFLAQTHILVCLLPLTPETQGILNGSLFAQLPKGAYLINVARGGHLVETELMDAIAQGQLHGACLDVFEQEPLSANHPFWTHSQITITPHCASITNPQSVAPQIIENYRRMQHGENLLNQVSLARGY